MGDFWGGSVYFDVDQRRGERADVGIGSAPSNFRQAVIRALIRKGVKVTPTGRALPGSKVDQQRIDDFIQQAWENQEMQAQWDYVQSELQTNPLWTDTNVINQMAAVIDKFAFTPSDQAGDLATLGIDLLSQSGVKLTSAQQTTAFSGSQQVPTLFPAEMYSRSGYGYMEHTGDSHEPVHEGVDYGLREGTALTAPFSGTVHVVPGAGGYGNMLELRAPSGWTIRLGHLSDFSVPDGATVQPGQLMGHSGSTGYSFGPHLHMELRDPQGNLHNPAELLEPIFKGATFDELGRTLGSGLIGSGVLSPSERARQEGQDSFLNQQYPHVYDDFRSLVGRNPTAKDILSVIECAGSTDPDRTRDCIRNLPSEAIPGMTVGQHHDARSLVDQISEKMLGHPGTDGVVRDLWAQGWTLPNEIRLWYDFHNPQNSGISPAQYNSIYKANQSHVQGKLNDNGFDPRIAQEQLPQPPEEDHPPGPGGGGGGSGSEANLTA